VQQWVIDFSRLKKKRNRSRMDIIVELLIISLEGAKKTKLMYSSNISFVMINEYLDLLIEKKLLAIEKDDKTYKTTEKGKEFLAKYDDMKL
jgi:predicted transcriptional regulator